METNEHQNGEESDQQQESSSRSLVPLESEQHPGRSLIERPSHDVVKLSSALAAFSKPFSNHSDALWRIRSELSRRCIEKGQRTFAILSPERCEGRSYLAANLAVAFSQLGFRVMLIDGDLRNPCQHEIFQTRNEGGLSLMLTSRIGPNLLRSNPTTDSLSIISAGKPPVNPLAMLSSDQLVRLLKRASDMFDVVLIDTPPAEAFGDAEAIAHQVDAAIIVARKGHSVLSRTATLIQRVKEAGTEVAGAVLNTF